jgi:argininosuccinate synthase
MAFTFDRKYLVVGHDDSQYAFVWDLDTLEQQIPIQFPSGHYPSSIAESGKSMLALVRNVTKDGPGTIDRIDFVERKAIQLPSLGVYDNKLDPATVLSPAVAVRQERDAR